MMTILRAILFIIGILIIIILAVANRQMVEVSFFPLPIATISMPLIAVFLCGLIIGALLGWLVVFFSTAKQRSEYTRLKRRARAQEHQKRVREQQEEEALAERSRERQQTLAIEAPAR